MDPLNRLAGMKGDFFIPANTLIDPNDPDNDFYGVWLDWITILDDAAAETVTTLEEMIQGVSTDVRAEHNVASGDPLVAYDLPKGYVLKATREGGFSKVQLTNPAQGFRLAPVLTRNPDYQNFDKGAFPSS